MQKMTAGQNRRPVPNRGPVQNRRPVQLRRCLAVLAAVSAVLHLMMLGHGPLGLGMLMAGLAVICFPCAGHLWRGPSPRAWAVVGAMNVGMLLIHLGMLTHSTTTHSTTTPSMATPTRLSPEPPGHDHGELWLALDHVTLLYAATAVAAVEVFGAVWAGLTYSGVLSGKAITERNRIQPLPGQPL